MAFIALANMYFLPLSVQAECMSVGVKLLLEHPPPLVTMCFNNNKYFIPEYNNNKFSEQSNFLSSQTLLHNGNYGKPFCTQLILTNTRKKEKALTKNAQGPDGTVIKTITFALKGTNYYNDNNENKKNNTTRIT